MVRKLNVLIACEESQRMTKAFRELGHNAFSCDIQKCAPDGVPAWHIMNDVTPYLRGKRHFRTMDGIRRSIPIWHLVIAHPPCTYMCRVSAVQLIRKGVIDKERERRMFLARDFFWECLNARALYVAVENPQPMARVGLPPASFFIQPSWFGEKYTKKTLFWTRGLPPILPTLIYPNPKCFTTSSRGKYRSRTFRNVAKACAEQWSTFILNELNNNKK